jgi:FlaA1/EpsC-like NDP-sugar epimerase
MTPASWLAGKSVLITGASGTIARTLLQEVLRARPKVLRALDNYEYGLFQLQQSLTDPESRVRWLLGDIRDGARLRRAMEDIEVVFHTAALKHVSIGEYNPFEIVQTNLVGLQNVIQAAIEANIERVLFTSSDKAVNPTNAMGASKLMGERLITAANGMRGSARTRFASVRFGNVLGSSGSVVRIFQEQIAQGGPLTLTDKRMTRFVMGSSKAVRFLLQAAELAAGGELFVLKMSAMRIADLADVMIRRLAPGGPCSIRVEEIGPRNGEKLYEELLTEAEMKQAYENEELIVYLGNDALGGEEVGRSYLKAMWPLTTLCRSDLVTPLTPAETEAVLEQERLLERHT